MTIAYRQAVPEDTPACVVLRGMTRENAFSVERLAEAGVTLESWQAGIADGSLPGHVATERGKIVGYCFGERETGEIAVLALLPEHEGQGAGRTLLNLVVDEFKALGFARLFLSCSADPASRSYGFYRHLGWRSTGSFDDRGDEILEYHLA
ncbi:MAG: GNAT family N-acetyltransferase [Bosea sp.]|uniref:GNAT family N-acetyltransferase n=1 Tax=Bosea sp. (in: a-proteobacteria) TaxID=1871050 RepID=UPI00239E8DE7|nr:GNAT family N-acetyltransferase [Bosea sp. (in: a-proteobacteria)]MCP4738362.1 GNAT family N-acetyltransferase [Bosea sp. (in: a-proteobacteria)]